MRILNCLFSLPLRQLAILGMAVLLTPFALPAGAATLAASYQVIDLGALGGRGSQATAINESGQIVGTAEDADGVRRVFLYENGVMRNLGVNGGGGRDIIINNKGQVAGNVYGINEEEGSILNNFFYDNGNVTLLNFSRSQITGLNDNGDLIGNQADAANPGITRAFLVRNGIMSSLGTLGGEWSRAEGINSKGQIVGRSGTFSAENAVGAFLYQNGVMSGLDYLNGWVTLATDINESGAIVGSVINNDRTNFCYLYDGDLKIFSYGDIIFKFDAVPLDVNNEGIAVGNTGGPFEPAAVIFRDGVTIDLNTLIVGDNPFRVLMSAESINDKGQIVGYGYAKDDFIMRAFLLNPIVVPEAGVQILACLGFALSFRRARRGGLWNS